MGAVEFGHRGEKLRCAACGEVIGVYEPLMHVIDGIAHRTSRAADPDLVASQRGTCYHVCCSDSLTAETVIVA